MLSEGHLKTVLRGARVAQSLGVALDAVVGHLGARVVGLRKPIGRRCFHVALRVFNRGCRPPRRCSCRD
eukprot:9856666-Lingulodinium_polyedra.AAC.1